MIVMLTPPPLVLLTRRLRLSTRNLCILTSRRLLSTGASPPFCIGFADWLSRRLSPCRLCFASPILALPPHVSFLYPPPCVCIGWLLCRILTRRLCLPSLCPRGRFLMASASCHAGRYDDNDDDIYGVGWRVAGGRPVAATKGGGSGGEEV